MPRIQFRQNAGDHALFSPTAFESQVGETVALNVDGKRVGTATLIAFEVIDEGRVVLLTWDVDSDEVVALLRAGWLSATG